MAVAALMARIGLIDLIARGSGPWRGFSWRFVIPVLTWGVWKIHRKPMGTNDERGAAPDEAGD